MTATKAGATTTGKPATKGAAKEKARAKAPAKKPTPAKAGKPAAARPAKGPASAKSGQKPASTKKTPAAKAARPTASKAGKGRPAPAAKPSAKKPTPATGRAGATKSAGAPRPTGALKTGVKPAPTKGSKASAPKPEGARKPSAVKAAKPAPARSKDGAHGAATAEAPAKGRAAAAKAEPAGKAKVGATRPQPAEAKPKAGEPKAAESKAADPKVKEAPPKAKAAEGKEAKTKGPEPKAAEKTKAPDAKPAEKAKAAEPKAAEKGKAAPPAPKPAEAQAAKPTVGKPGPAAPPRAPTAEDGARPRPGGPGHRMEEPAPPPKRYPPPPPPRKLDLSRQKVVPEAPDKTDLPFPVLRRGKVREVYQLDRSELLIVTSDRVSAFDVVMKETIPRKGEVLTMLSAWWLARLETKGVEHHLISVIPDQIVEMHPELAQTRKQWERRAMLVRKTEPIPVECVVRGYLAGSAWKDYQETRLLAGERLPEELQEGQRLPRPMWAPATKAITGHDENITPLEVRMALGEQLATRLERLALRIYDHGRRAAEGSGIILADTKYEFGMDYDSRLLLIDEVMTPDSSRFWPKQSYAPGKTQPSLDKQPIRDWLESQPEWDKKPPPPKLPPAVVAATTERYLEIFRRLTGTTLDDFQPPLLRGVVP